MPEFEMLASGGLEAHFQQALAYLFAQQSTGLVAPGVLAGLAVTQTGTASGSVLVASGCGIAQDVVGNGVTPLVNNSSKTQDVFTANPANTLPRNDIVIFDASTTTIRIVTGTPNASPADPAVPATSFPLARLRHAANATTIPAAKIDDLRTFTSLAIAPSLQAGAWVNCTVNGNWTATAGFTPQARLLPFDLVQVRGAVTSAASVDTNNAVTLPTSAYNPTSNRFLNAHQTSGSGSSKTFNPYVLSGGSGTIKIDPAYHDGGALIAGAAYPISGIYSIT